jgi:hypothetical protein
MVKKFADLSPALGRPGGPCQIVRRIVEEVRDPRWSEDLASKVEDGEDLSNAEAAKVYDLQVEKCRGVASKMALGPHAQYRMDLRSITVNDLRVALEDFAKDYYREKSKESAKFQHFKQLLEQGQKIEYISSKGLAVVFLVQNGSARIVTTFWKGVPDPAPPKDCKIALKVAARSQRIR